jgi:hypothetical protein
MFRSTERVSEGSDAGHRVGLALALVLLAASGCSGEERLTKGGYEEAVRAEYANVQAAFESTRGASDSELAARIEDAERALRHAAEVLEAKEPPEQVEEENGELVEGMREYAAQLDRLARAVGEGDDLALERFNRGIAQNEAVEQMAEAAEEMKFMGYDLGRIAEE